MTRRRPAFVCGPPDNGCYVMGRKAGDLHRWEATTKTATEFIGYGQGPQCLACGLPWGTWHIDVACELVRARDNAPDRAAEAVAAARVLAHNAARPYAYVPALEVACPFGSCGAAVLEPCPGRRAPHHRRAVMAAARGFDGSDL